MNATQEEIKTLTRRRDELNERIAQLESGQEANQKGGRSNPINEEGQAMRPDVESKR